MKNILILQQKGGCGKSTLALELVRSLQRTGTPAAFYDLDGQSKKLQPFKDKGAVASVIDTPGSLSDQMPEWVEAADAIIVPVIPSGFDLDAFRRTMSIVQSNARKKTAVFIVLNQFTRWRSSQDFEEFITSLYPDIEILKVPQSELFRQASGQMESVISFRKKSTAADAVLMFVNRVRESVGLPKE